MKGKTIIPTNASELSPANSKVPQPIDQSGLTPQDVQIPSQTADNQSMKKAETTYTKSISQPITENKQAKLAFKEFDNNGEIINPPNKTEIIPLKQKFGNTSQPVCNTLN